MSTAASAAAATAWGVDRTIAFWSAIGGMVSAIMAMLTAVLAALIYFEAQRIRRVEWASASGRNWQDFNRLILEGTHHEKWGALLAGDLTWEELSQRERMLIYSFLNVLLFEFNARGHGLLESAYAEKSIGQNIVYLRHVWPGLLDHLVTDGWPMDFLSAANRAIEAANADAAAG